MTDEAKFPDADDDGFDLSEAVRLCGVSRETSNRIRVFIATLDAWRGRLNLIGRNEGRHLWRRHVFDSLQLVPHLPQAARSFVDLGTGAGFPGVVLACALYERPERIRIAMVEKSPRKAEFLNAVSRATGVAFDVLPVRAEETQPPQRFDILTARALAPLDRLLGYASNWLAPDGVALFLKGKETSEELTRASESWTFHATERPSLTSAEGRLLVMTGIGAKPEPRT